MDLVEIREAARAALQVVQQPCQRDEVALAERVVRALVLLHAGVVDALVEPYHVPALGALFRPRYLRLRDDAARIAAPDQMNEHGAVNVCGKAAGVGLDMVRQSRGGDKSPSTEEAANLVAPVYVGFMMLLMIRKEGEIKGGKEGEKGEDEKRMISLLANAKSGCI